MKKLLSILGIIGLTATAGTTVIACQVHNDYSVWKANNMLSGYLYDKRVDPADKTTKKDRWLFGEVSDQTYNELFQNYDSFFKEKLFDKVQKFAEIKKENKGKLKITVDMTDKEIADLSNSLAKWADKALGLIYVIDGKEKDILDENMMKDWTLTEILKYFDNKWQKDIIENSKTSLAISFDKKCSVGIGASLSEIKDPSQQAPNFWEFEFSSKE